LELRYRILQTALRPEGDTKVIVSSSRIRGQIHRPLQVVDRLGESPLAPPERAQPAVRGGEVGLEQEDA
jgi:hypothetical protein